MTEGKIYSEFWSALFRTSLKSGWDIYVTWGVNRMTELYTAICPSVFSCNIHLLQSNSLVNTPCGFESSGWELYFTCKFSAFSSKWKIIVNFWLIKTIMIMLIVLNNAYYQHLTPTFHLWLLCWNYYKLLGHTDITVHSHYYKIFGVHWAILWYNWLVKYVFHDGHLLYYRPGDVPIRVAFKS